MNFKILPFVLPHVYLAYLWNLVLNKYCLPVEIDMLSKGNSVIYQVFFYFLFNKTVKKAQPDLKPNFNSDVNSSEWKFAVNFHWSYCNSIFLYFFNYETFQSYRNAEKNNIINQQN